MVPIASKASATGRAKPPVTVNPKIPKLKKTVEAKNTDKSKVIKPTTPTKPSARSTQEASSTKLRPRTPQVPKTPLGTKKVASPSITKGSKKPSWQRRPKAAHSGVPIPEKLRKFLLEEEKMRKKEKFVESNQAVSLPSMGRG